MTTQYTNWKQQQEPSIYTQTWRPNAAVILMMILDRIKEKHILGYIRDELKLKHPKQVLRECRDWSGAPDPHMFTVLRKKRKAEVLELLTMLWQNECKVPHCEKALAIWVPVNAFGFDYDTISEKEAEMELDRLKLKESVDDEIAKRGIDEDDLKEKLEILNGFVNGSSSGESPLATENHPSESDEPSQQGPLLSHPQQMAIKELGDAYAVCQRAQDLDTSISPRTNCLMVGPSGSGKTFLARAFAEQKGVPFMSVNVSSWTLIASRIDSENYTLVQIAAFIASYPNGIIYLDELDKIDGSDYWNNHLRLEIHNLLDGQIGVEVLDGLQKRLEMPVSSDALENLNRVLKNDFFIIAGGTWQGFWENRIVSSVGFNASEEMRTLDKEELTKHITPELLQRFQQARIVLEPLTVEDFLTLSDQIAEQLKGCEVDPATDHTATSKLFLQAVANGVKDAVNNKIGMRFLEECITHALKPSVAEAEINHRDQSGPSS